MSPKFEVRWLVRPGWDGPEKVLQYRYVFKQTNYGITDPQTHDFVKEKVWSDWIDVPTVEA